MVCLRTASLTVAITRFFGNEYFLFAGEAESGRAYRFYGDGAKARPTALKRLTGRCVKAVEACHYHLILLYSSYLCVPVKAL